MSVFNYEPLATKTCIRIVILPANNDAQKINKASLDTIHMEMQEACKK